MNLLLSTGDEHLHDRRAQPGHGGQDDPTEGRVRLLLQLAVAAATQVGNENNVELFRNISLEMRSGDCNAVHKYVSPDGITRRVTVLQTSVTRSSSTATSTLETLQGLSSPPSRTGDSAA